jgi:hypothetical protein
MWTVRWGNRIFFLMFYSLANIECFINKLLELSDLFNSDLIKLDIFCFTEYWLMEKQMRVLNIVNFKLVSNFSMFSSNHGGSWFFVWKVWQNKEINYLKGIGSKIRLEMTVVELLDFKFTLAWAYRSPDGGFCDFFEKVVISNL